MKELLATMLQYFISENKEVAVSEETQRNIKRLQKICNKHYFNQSHCGNAALNRAILLDGRIAELLTPDTINAILYFHAANYQDLQKETKIKEKSILVKRNSSGSVSLAAVLYYGFSEGVQTIKCISNNQKNFSTKENFVRNYYLQSEKFTTHTQKIINNIKTAARNLNIPQNPEDNLNLQSPNQSIKKLYLQIKATIELIHDYNFSSSFFFAPGIGINNLVEETKAGFLIILEILGYKKQISVTLKEFAEQIVTSNHIILNPLIGHIFWDRLHLEVLIKHPAKYTFKDGKYNLETIFSTLVSSCSKNPIAQEQITLRLRLVENHCKHHFPAFYENRGIKEKKPFAYFVLRDHLTRLELEEENQLWEYKKLSPYHNECKNFLIRTLNLYDGENFGTIKQCLLKAKKFHQIGYRLICNKIQEEDPLHHFFLTALADPSHLSEEYETLMEKHGKNKASTDFAILIKLLLTNKGNAKCSFNILNELEIIVNDQYFFNVTQILEGEPDLNQIQLEEELLNNYVELIRKEMEEMDLISCWHSKSPQLHKAQKAAFILYSTEKYVAKIQNFARNAGRVPTYRSHVIIRLLLIMGVSASSQSTNSNLTTYRSDRLNNKLLNRRIQAIKRNIPLREEGFFSTSKGVYLQHLPKKNAFTICYPPLQKPNGFDITKLSICQGEAEVNFPPGTRIHWLDYWDLDGFYIFSAVPVPTSGYEPSSYNEMSMFLHEVNLVHLILTTESPSFLQKFGIFQQDFSVQLTLADKLKPLMVSKQPAQHRQILDHCIQEFSKVKKEKIQYCCQRLIRAKSYIELHLANQEAENEASQLSQQENQLSKICL